MALGWLDAVEAAKSSRKSGDITFIKASECPVKFVPLARVLPYEQVFDAAQKKSRKPVNGEKASHRFLFEAADADGKVGLYVCGPQVIEAVASVMKTAAQLGKAQVGVVVTATGSGMDTEYSAELDMALTAKIKDGWVKHPEKPYDLEAIRDSLLGEVVAPTTKENTMEVAASQDVPF